MNDYRRTEKAATNREARETTGMPHPRAFNAEAVDAALIRYLAAQEYREHVEETREAKKDDKDQRDEKVQRRPRAVKH